jgi:hypothetical protein
LIFKNSSSQSYFPPYGFSLNQKRDISKALSIIDSYGRLVFNENIQIENNYWQKCVNTILNCIWNGITIKEDLPSQNKLNFILSYVHGDLNAGNILCDLNKGRVFLIDLTHYQKDGHILQDFARLETEIKFKFMDTGLRQGKHFYKDLCPELIHSWLSVEDILYDADWNCEEISLSNIDESHTIINRCGVRSLNLIAFIRNRAKEIQKYLLGIQYNENDFIDTYFIALLYHTIRTIAYYSLPITKRIFAVYSAAKLLNTLNKTTIHLGCPSSSK